MKATVVLFRSGDEADPYEEALRDAGYVCQSVPVLRFEFVNERELRNALEHPRSYDGLILTSPRAVEALTMAMPWLPTENVVWHAKAIFAVGPRTASELRAIGFDPTGEGSGSAEMLAEYVLHRDFERPLLFLCGDRRRDTLPSRLRECGITLEELCIYESHERTDLALASRPSPDWAVFFSPSGVEAVQRDQGWDLTRLRIAAIGETTSEALRSKGISVHAVAEEPTPDALALAIRVADTDRMPRS